MGQSFSQNVQQGDDAGNSSSSSSTAEDEGQGPQQLAQPVPPVAPVAPVVPVPRGSGSGTGSVPRGRDRRTKAERKRERTLRRKRLKKRARSGEDDEDDSEADAEEHDQLLRTPKKRKLKTTSRYIYETLFLQNRDSDVTVTALGREWKLHRLYLEQSGYFSAMFSGAWAESPRDKIEIDVADENITADAFHAALGSLYQDEMSVEPSAAVPILAAGTLLQLDGLIEQSTQLMKETVNAQTVLKYLDAAERYGAVTLQSACHLWLRVNLLSSLPENLDRLRELPMALLSTLIASPDLFVMQTEFSLYVLMRLWVYLQLQPHWLGNPQDAVVQSHRHFQSLAAKNPRGYFLESAEGSRYAPLFRRLRLIHLVNHHMDMEMMMADRIIPDSWMTGVYRDKWQTLLRVDQGVDRGPEELSEAKFDKECLRCGRTLTSEGQQHMWRWTGFNMGLDLVVTFDTNLALTLKRNHSGTGGGGLNSADHEALLSGHKRKKIFYKVTVAAINDQKQVTYQTSSGLQHCSLGKNASQTLLRLDASKVTYPLLLSFNFAVAKPLPRMGPEEEDDGNDEGEGEEPAVMQEMNIGGQQILG